MRHARHPGVAAAALVLEITERALMRATPSRDRTLRATCARSGSRLSIDDFGTGYSSLAYLPRLPLDSLKIDRTLVSRVGGARDTVPSVLRLGRDLSLSVIAEGVETVEQLVMLRGAGCTLGQGHLFAPGPPAGGGHGARGPGPGRSPDRGGLAARDVRLG